MVWNFKSLWIWAFIKKNNERLIQSYFGGDDYKSNVIQLIYDALNKNENEGLKFIEYILKNYTNVSEEDIINVFPKDLNYLDSNKEKFNKCFISYAHENRDIGHQIKRELEKCSISCFLAHEDIECSQEW